MINILKNSVKRSKSINYRFVLIFKDDFYFYNYTDMIVTSKKNIEEFENIDSLKSRVEELGFIFK